jgi:opacity protein-like surface antigen
MKKLLVMMTVLAMCATSALCAEVTPKKKGPSAKAYEQASDKAAFKRTVESKEKTVKKEVKAQEKSSKTKSKGKKKGFLWW